ncbi:MAG: dephospho-CoA kinase [Omnitrophica WOR_2 bacterium RIFCSPHIGHO2_02_FULL_68_15]|nr:MAG: dephospho-CoA kinase [Omnitrophica WOR_2 bacterium RIFCSPHIGHO2_02_FULL_68_15]
MIVIGVTGSLGTGKSTVARLLARRGAHRLDADAMAHALMAPGTPVWRRLRRRFGAGVVQPDGRIDRPALAAAGFASRDAWRDLCRIVHPAVIAATRRSLAALRRRARPAVVVLDVPLLIESGMTSLVDWVVVVTADRRAQLARARRRWPAAEILRRLRRQMPLAEKVRRADVVIDNNGSRRATAVQVRRFWERIVG